MKKVETVCVDGSENQLLVVATLSVMQQRLVVGGGDGWFGRSLKVENSFQMSVSLSILYCHCESW